MTTVKAVALRAGVSAATAARVLRADPTLNVRPDTRERVLAAARELDYRPNRLAAGLRTRRTGTIAIVLPDPQNLGWSDMLRGVARAAAERDYVAVVVDSHGPTLDRQLLARFVLEGRMDGLLVAFATIEDELVAQIVGRGLPLVPINSRAENVGGSVTMNDAMGSRLAVDHLVALGHRRIAFLAGRADTDVGRRREAGYREAMSSHRLPVEQRWVLPGDFTERTAHDLGAALLRGTPNAAPTAIFTVNLASALGFQTAVMESGRKISEHISLVTMDDHPILKHFHPPLTAIELPMAEMGELGVAMLIDVVEGRPMRHVVTTRPPSLVIRGSTGTPYAG